MSRFDEAAAIVTERFGRDTLISVATVDGDRPSVRTVNAYYADGAFYSVTYAFSNKMKHIKRNPQVAVCGEWFAAHGIGENLGHINAAKNADIAAKLREAFAAWYSNGHTDESDPNTCILRIRLTDSVIFKDRAKYEIVDFDKRQARKRS